MEQERQRRIIALLQASPWHMAVIAAARRLDLPDWGVGAGFVRNLVWDHLHGRAAPTPLNDVDLLYFDTSDTGRAAEARAERALRAALPDCPWSVRNQARMHLGNGDRPYRDTGDAMAHWLETATAVAVRQEPGGRLSLLAPCGTADLFALRIVPTPAGRRRAAAFETRLRAKDWPGTWPKLVTEIRGDAGSSPRR